MGPPVPPVPILLQGPTTTTTAMDTTTVNKTKQSKLEPPALERARLHQQHLMLIPAHIEPLFLLRRVQVQQVQLVPPERHKELGVWNRLREKRSVERCDKLWVSCRGTRGKRRRGRL